LETLAIHYETTGNALEAIHHLEKVSVLEPRRKDIFVRLADLYKQEHYYKEAIDRYWSANAIDGNDPHIHRNLLEIFQTLSLIEEARLETLERESAVAKTP
jgi:tetratricopeptide (TPR) repeat protein